VKLLVQSIGNHTLLDLYGHQEIAAERPSVVTRTPFIDVNRGRKLEVLEELADEATDEPLAAAQNDDELAAALAALPRREKPEPKVAAKPKK
jgi:hypothetical protein